MNSNKYFIWNKGDDIQLSKNFNSKEFDCQCTRPACVEQRISIDLVEKIELIRKEINQPLTITSGFRCFNHQQDLKDKGTVSTVIAQKSTHVLGDAVDIKIPKNNTIDTFLERCEKHFESIGIAKTFLHLDLRKGKRRWNY